MICEFRLCVGDWLSQIPIYRVVSAHIVGLESSWFVKVVKGWVGHMCTLLGNRSFVVRIVLLQGDGAIQLKLGVFLVNF